MRALLVGALLLGGCATRLIDATDGGGGDGGGALQYQAFDVPTNQPRVSIQKVDGGKQRCTTILLVGFTGRGPNPPGLTLPVYWNLEGAWQQSITNGGCAQLTPPSGSNFPTAISGKIEFDNSSAPSSVNIHAQLTIGTSVEMMDADNLSVKPGSQ